MPALTVLKNKVAGHTTFIDLGRFLLKGMDVREYRFYRNMQKCSDEFKSIFPTFYGVKHLIDPDEGVFEDVNMDEFDAFAEENRLAKNNELKDYFICIENFTYKMKYPCSMDIKLGSHWSYAGVSDSRGKRYDSRWEKTTSANVGLRYCGHIGYANHVDDSLEDVERSTVTEVPDSSPQMYRVYQSKNVGWSLKIEHLEDTLCQFFHYPELKFRPELVKNTIEGVKRIVRPLVDQKLFTFRSTSLLLVYDALGTTDEVRMALIDFSHEFEVTPDMINEEEGLVPGDPDIVNSLQNLIKLLEHRLERENETEA